MVGESQETVGAGVGGSQSAGSNKLPTLSEYGTNLTQQAAEVSRDAADTEQHVADCLWCVPCLCTLRMLASLQGEREQRQPRRI